MKAHELGLLHRAVSIFIFNSKGEWLIQKRGVGKYHSGGLWSNTCCSHPYPNEKIETTAKRRLMEEMGICCELKKTFSFTYKVELDNNLIEHEVDYIFMGITNQLPNINPEEVSDWKYEKETKLQKDLEENPKQFTKWFRFFT